MPTRSNGSYGPKALLGSSSATAPISAVVSISSSTAAGSGFFISPTGLIITNEHVVQMDQRVEVATENGDVYLGRVISRSVTDDLALVQVDTTSHPFLKLLDSRSIRVGQAVFAIGSPRGLGGSVSKGIVSALRSGGSSLFVQTDAAINPGNSGGPLVLEDGSVIGVNTFKLRDSEGLNFAVATEVVRRLFGEHLD